MWPHQEGIGTRLNYGVDGEALVVPKQPPGSGATVVSARLRNNPLAPTLYCQPTTRELLAALADSEAQRRTARGTWEGLGTTSASAIANLMIRLMQLLIPLGVLEGIQEEDRQLARAADDMPPLPPAVASGAYFDMIDPTELTKFAYYELKGVPHLAYAVGSVLTLSMLGFAHEAVAPPPGELANLLATVPTKILDPVKVQFNDPIQQLVVREITVKKKLARSATHLAVRCRKKVYVLRIGKDGLLSQLVFEVDCASSALVDLRENGDVVVVEARGEYCVYPELDPHTSYPGWIECDELLSWKLALWCQESLYIALRQTLSVIEEGELSIVALFPDWAHIVDLLVVDSRSFVMCTAKEIIWFHDRKRVVSWEVFLTPTTRTRLQIKRWGDEEDLAFTCMVYFPEMVIVYTFGWVDGRPVSLQDPYMLKGLAVLPRMELFSFFDLPQGEFKDGKLVESDKKPEATPFTGLFEMASDGALCFRLLGNKDMFGVPEPEPTEFEQALADPKPRRKNAALRPHELLLRLLAVLDPLHPMNTGTEEPSILACADALGRYASEILPQDNEYNSDAEEVVDITPVHKVKRPQKFMYNPRETKFTSAAQIAPPGPVANMVEMDEMVGQLRQFYDSKDVRVVVPRAEFAKGVVNPLMAKTAPVTAKQNIKEDVPDTLDSESESEEEPEEPQKPVENDLPDIDPRHLFLELAQRIITPLGFSPHSVTALGTSLIRTIPANATARILRKCDKKMEAPDDDEFAPRINELLGRWDEDYAEATQGPAPEEEPSYYRSQTASQMPTIKLSQPVSQAPTELSQLAPVKAKKRKLGLSQLASQSLQKRKKKKKGGFA